MRRCAMPVLCTAGVVCLLLSPALRPPRAGAGVAATVCQVSGEVRQIAGVVHPSRGESIARGLEARGVSRTLAVAVISMLPIVELRGAIPVGIAAFGMPWWKVYAIAVIGNLVPIPFLLLLLGPVSRLLMRLRAGRAFFEWLFARTRRKSAQVAKYEALGLTIFVAIPLPVTGGWTGAVAAFLMGISFWQALICIALGVMIAGIIMTALSLLGWVGAVIAGVALIAITAASLVRRFNRDGREGAPS